MKQKFLSLLLACTMSVNLIGCTTQKPNDSSATYQSQTDEKQANTFTDDLGRTISIPDNISKIVPSSSLAQIILFSIAPDKLVGLSNEFYDSAKGIIDDKYFDLPVFGSLYASADLNVEELALVNPEVIVDIGDTKDSSIEDLDNLKNQTNIPTVFISSDLKSMPETYRKLGNLLDEQEKGEQLAEFCEKIYNRTVSIMDKVGDNKVNTLYVIGKKGLNVLAKNSYHSELLDLITNNVAVVDNPLSKGTGNEVSMEQISLWNPDFVIFAPDSIYDTVKADASWSNINAIKNNNYIKVPDSPNNWLSMPPSVQRYLGLIWLPYVLYPDYCDYDVKEDIKEFYKLFYNCTLTDEQYEKITEKAFI